ncbi:N-glycosylase/DNA lyase [Pyrococcus yayanosii]|uniref:N-glycosylase/DNA lyase n=1 Tax=Pyrococcus yayanosii (strain CH1 / JCM 16557) TaxID=529709 RepID=F8AIL3_PYRYC|nr:N-glycosylase/DNA lyase [Pyrococcus yayanosii]AEH24379.1 N-glycosylase/DNA lyase [Pyrococcus yayanosii CH1]
MTPDRFLGLDDNVARLKGILGKLGIECARTIEERVDLQFDALRNLWKNLGDEEPFLKLVIANAVVSYQLSGKGEDWWWEFSQYFSKNPPRGSIAEAYARFLPQSKTNRRLVGRKVARLRKLEPFLARLDLGRLRYYYRNMLSLQSNLANVLGTGKSTKTVVFAVKMFGYACRITFGEFRPYPMEIPIPEDVRIRAYTRRFTREPPATFWSRIARDVGIPPLHIDSILWPVLGGDERVIERLRRHCKKADLVLELANLGTNVNGQHP